MRDYVNLAAVAALAVAQLAAVPAMAQPTNTMATPLPEIDRSNRPRPPGNNNNWNNGNNNNNNWNGEIIRCESRDGRRNRCRADTRGGVRLVRQLGNTQCREGRTWGWNSNEIWVDNGCRGEFQLRQGSGQSSNNNSGPSAGAIIGGVAIAGGLIALLSQSGKSSAPPANTVGNPAPPTATPVPLPAPLPAPPAGPARISAEMGGVTPNARPSLTTCLNEAARQVGATGGTEIRLDRLDEIEPGNGGFRFRFQLKAIYPDETRSIPTFCRATPTKLVELTFG